MKKNNNNFKTTEVIVLVLLTCIISLIMGYNLNSKFKSNKYADIIENDEQLAGFISTYQDVVENYYEKIDKKELIENAIDGMFSSLDVNSNLLKDNNASNFNKQLDGEYKGIGIEVVNDEENNIIILNVFDDTPAKQAGLEPLDIIKSIDGKDLQGKETNELIKIINKTKDSFKLKVMRDDKEIEITVKKDLVTLKSITSEVITKNDKLVGYIKISIFANNTAEQFKSNYEKLKKENIDSLIIDVRDNSGGHLTAVSSILSQLMDKKHVIYQIKDKNKTEKFYSEGNSTEKCPIIVLINNSSASASEVLASALNEQLNAVLVGEKSFGKGTVQELQGLNNGNYYKITTKKWLTSKGKWINEKGIKPDVEVSMDENYYNNPTKESDNQLQEALNKLTIES